MGTPGPQKVNRYGVEFKLKAVQLSHQPGVMVKDVAASLCVHPFMLSLWRKQVRDGVLRGALPKLDVAAVGELQRLREVERRFKLLQVEHDLLKKAIRFACDPKHKPSPSSRQTGTATRSK